ncbi:polysaccharide biosynthesis/export family protein [Pseudogemmobacter faecipullorum]|uniref:Polysaccharide biosynthesis/export family protein n=1 Tax=Pseudogemmobacter faecipullorum TaxID=2755041 RepID=A0ABS8CN59_9RHOB|nr:polysaccharide biosynthesis/export family protein [Pseudogemmobacter faecipullorum]MCB5410824.1 polysaccharide biosynthesis/export family protein [Pseudogemmobacter faecipullorum]
MRIRWLILLLALGLSGCGALYHSPSVRPGLVNGAKLRVIDLTPESLLAANAAPLAPASLPLAFHQTTGAAGPGRAAALPDLPAAPADLSAATGLHLPPDPPAGPYLIGTGDMLSLSREPGRDSPGPLRVQQHRVQDDGAIALPELGRITLAGLTLEQAEAALFTRLIERGADPGVSLEISEFNARRVTISGGVARPGLVPLTLDAALASAGGLSLARREAAVIRLYRGGQLYSLPVSGFLTSPSQQKLRLADGDAIFVDPTRDPGEAETWFDQQIRLAEARSAHRASETRALSEEVALRRAALEEQRLLFERRRELGAESAGYVFLTGEVARPGRWPLPFERSASLADALYERGGVLSRTGNPRQIYVLRGAADPRDFAAITAWHLDGGSATGMVLATRMLLRPDDVIFVAEQPVTRWSRVIDQISPSLIAIPLDNVTTP